MMNIFHNLVNAAESAKNALSAQHDLYHFLMAVSKYGEEVVLSEMVEVYKQMDFNYLEASERANAVFRHYQEINDGFLASKITRYSLEEKEEGQEIPSSN